MHKLPEGGGTNHINIQANAKLRKGGGTNLTNIKDNA